MIRAPRLHDRTTWMYGLTLIVAVGALYLAFELGPIEGLTADDVKAYIRYVADWRLGQLGLPKVYGVKEHPLPWLTAILNGVEHANFFETRATEYAKAATGGAWHGTEGAWGLFDRRVARRGQLDLIARPD